MTITNRPESVVLPRTMVQHARYVCSNARPPGRAPGDRLRGAGARHPGRAYQEDPLLLIGRSGTGKTFLLNTLSEALGLEHRHYNASLISFDDLVGFPYPDPDGNGVRFLETPATVWGAESVLIDEISRCKPEHQNRLFSLVHERRCRASRSLEAALALGGDESVLVRPVRRARTTSASEPLDPALADRFALFVDGGRLGRPDRSRAPRRRRPSGEGRIASDGGALRKEIDAWRRALRAASDQRCRRSIWPTRSRSRPRSTPAASASRRGARGSSRRSLLARTIVTGKTKQPIFRSVLSSACRTPAGASSRQRGDRRRTPRGVGQRLRQQPERGSIRS